MERKSLLYANTSQTESRLLAMETSQDYKNGAITHKNLAILPLEGQQLTLKDLETKSFWSSDPYPDLESLLLQNVHNKSIGNRTSFFGGESKLWQYINKTAASLSKEEGIKLDIYNLTPAEAVFLVKEIVRRELSYDQLMLGGITQDHISKNSVNTARPDILGYYHNDKSKFNKEASSYIASVDSKTADQILDHRYVICRHVAAVSSVLYESIRKKQHSLLMNGSYLIYHDESLGDQHYKASVGEHAFNILYVTRPEKNRTLVQTSVIDPTFVIGESHSSTNPDHTIGRISQCCSSLSEIGYLFDIGQTDIKKLSGIAADRVKNKLLGISPIFCKDEPQVSKTNLVSDFLSLAFQSNLGEEGKVLDSLFDIYISKNKSREEMVESILLLPPLTYQSDKSNKCIYKNWIPELIKQLQKINFKRKSQTHTGIIMLIEHIANQITVEQISADKEGHYMSLLSEYNRIITT